MTIMAKKITGISLELLSHPGEILEESLEGHNMSQKELAERTGFTEAYISNVIAGKKDISANFAKGLEYALGTSSGSWLGLQADYDEFIMDYKDEHSITNQEFKKYQELKVLNHDTNIKNDFEGVLSLRKSLHINNLLNIKKISPEGVFKMDKHKKMDPYFLGAWILMCKNEKETIYEGHDLSADEMTKLVVTLKLIMISHKKDIAKEVKECLNDNDIEFTVMPYFEKAPVQGYLTLNKRGVYHVFIAPKDNNPETFWLALFHELAHMFCKDVTEKKKFLDSGLDTKKEKRAEKYAANMLLPPEPYKAFIKKNDFSKKAIKQYASDQFVREYIVIDRLKKDGLL